MPLAKPDEEITMAAFARLMGATQTTVASYIRDGKICEPALVRKENGKVKHLLKAAAERQFLDARDAVAGKFAASGGAKLGVIPGGKPSPGRPRKEKLTPAEDAALDALFVANGVAPLGSSREARVAAHVARLRGEPAPADSDPDDYGKPRPQAGGGWLKSGPGFGGDEDDLPDNFPNDEDDGPTDPGTSDEDDEDGLPSGTTGQISKRLLAIKTKTAQVALDEKLGRLVDVQKVRRVLFVAGQELRSGFEQLPDRIIDDILAMADNRPAAHAILTRAIKDTLQRISDLPNVNLTPEQAAAPVKGTR